MGKPVITQSPPQAPPQRHPRGLYTLFFTEMWERFSYYGMRALLVLFMVDKLRGGMDFPKKYAAAIYGLYTAGVYLAALPGGWVADRLLGARQAVWYGGIIIALGHLSLAIPSNETFFLGLVLLVVGTGLLKPNISAMVGQLYPEGGPRRDSGFTIFYMGINFGAAIGPFVCSYLGENINWHLGFGAASLGMFLGLLQYRLSARHLGEVGKLPGSVVQQQAAHPDARPPSTINHQPSTTAWLLFYAGLALIALITGLALARVITINPIILAQYTTYLIVGLAVVYFAYAFLSPGLTATEKKRVCVIVVLFLSSAMFWSGFEQAGSSLNLFADLHTRRSFLGWVIPTGWFQILNPAFLVTLAPVVAAVWLALGRRHRNPSLPVKFAVGLMLLGAGFLVMFGAARLVISGGQVSPAWLIVTYLLHTIGELCLSPVGLSSVTKLSPPRLVGQMMGIWFLGTSLGNLVAGLIAGEVTGESAAQMPAQFLQIVLTTCGAGALLLLFAKPIKKLMAGVE
jgi:POT family proton-dependent oligopeptide transporter